MAFDSGFCTAVAWELSRTAVGKVTKVTMPAADRIVLSMYLPGRDRSESDLIVCASPSSPMVMLGHDGGENPPTPSGFCMLLRKHLTSARLTGARCPDFERVIMLDFERKNELGYGEQRTLCAELMGKYSNVFLLSGDGRILGALRSGDITNGKRLTVTGAPYERPPVQDKLCALDVTYDQFEALADAAGDRAADEFLIGAFSGLAPLTAREMAYNASGSTDTPVSACKTRLREAFFDILSRVRNETFEPYYAQTGQGREFAYYPIRQYGTRSEKVGSFSELQKTVIAERTTSLALADKKRELIRAVNSALTHTRRKAAMQTADLESCADKESLRSKGELILSNISVLRQGMREAELYDYTLEKNVRVALDERLMPALNAQRYFRRYKKAVSTEKNVTLQLARTHAELEYLESVDDLLKRASTDREIEELREEFAAAGYSRSRERTRVSRTRTRSEPFVYTTGGGFTVKVGRNNIQNDELTFSAAKTDYWFHVKDVPGSHVILFAEGREPSDDDLTEAAAIAARHSSAADSPSVAVDYTLRKYVRKPPGAKPGYVTYEHFKTAFIRQENKK